MTLEATIKRTGGVPSNYGIMLAGVFFFPIQIIAFLFSRKRRFGAGDWEPTHYEMQYRTTMVYLIIQMILFGVSAISMSYMSGKSHADITKFLDLWPFLSALSYAPMLWLAIRSVRGLYLAGAKKGLVYPRSFTIWPR